MKRIFCFILSLITVLLLSSCGSGSENPQNPVNFYYCNRTIAYNSESAIITAEILESSSSENSLAEFLTSYLAGPQSEELYSPFPAGTDVMYYERDNDTMHIYMTAEFADLHGADLTIACTCLAKTLYELTECKTIVISVPDHFLDGNTSIIMDIDNIILQDHVSSEL